MEVTIKQAAESFQVIIADKLLVANWAVVQVTSNDLNSCVNADFKNESKGLMEVLNLATSQIPFFS